MEYSNENRGVLFKNDNKGDNEKAPDYRGKLDVGGKEYQLSAWIKTSAKGKFMSISIQEPFKPKDKPQEERYSKTQAAMDAQAPSGFDEEMDGQIPF